MTDEQYESLKGMVRATALTYYPRIKSYAELGDVEQEIWCTIMTKLPRFNPDESSLVTFLFPYMQRAAQMFLRKVMRMHRNIRVESHLPTGREGESEGMSSFEKIGVDASQEHQIDLKRIEEQLNAMWPQTTSRIIYLKAQGYSFDEIAAEMSSNKDAVRMTFNRAYKSMKAA